MQTEDTQHGDFEIHVGFASEDIKLSERLSASAGWSFAYVREVVVPAMGRGMYDSHDVPGHLGLLATKRRSTYTAALDEVDAVAETYSGCQRIRIELEEVLLTHLGSAPGKPTASGGYMPIAADLVHATLITDTPPFEIHFGVFPEDTEHPLAMRASTLVDILGQAQVPLHEAVHFSSKSKITTTTFYPSYLDIAAACGPLTEKVIQALAGTHLQIKLAAERILLCAKPLDSQNTRRRSP